MNVEHYVPLAPRCTLRVGGPARFFVRAQDEATLVAALEWADAGGVPVRVLGGGSNVVISDEGVDAMVLRVGLRGRRLRLDPDGTAELTAMAGEPWDDLVEHAVGLGCAGLECLSGIPGLVGAAPIQNVGAYGQDVAGTLSRVRAYDRIARSIVTLTAGDCQLAYRDSLFKSGAPDRYVVLDVTFRLRQGGPPTLRYPELETRVGELGLSAPSLADVRREVLALRRRKSMLLDDEDPNARSCGSFFVNPVLPAEEADRLERRGTVGLSTRHALALVCHDGARAADLLEFAREVRDRVRDRLGVTLTPEPVLWGFRDPGL